MILPPFFKYEKSPQSPLLVFKKNKDPHKKNKLDFELTECVFKPTAVPDYVRKIKENSRKASELDLLRVNRPKWNPSILLERLYKKEDYLEDIMLRRDIEKKMNQTHKHPRKKPNSALASPTKKTSETPTPTEPTNPTNTQPAPDPPEKEDESIFIKVKKGNKKKKLSFNIGQNNNPLLLDSIKNRSRSHERTGSFKLRTNGFMNILDKFQKEVQNIITVYVDKLPKKKKKRRFLLHLPKPKKAANAKSKLNSTFTDKTVTTQIFSLSSTKHDDIKKFMSPYTTITKQIPSEKKRPNSTLASHNLSIDAKEEKEKLNYTNCALNTYSAYIEAYNKVYNVYEVRKKKKEDYIAKTYDIFYIHPGIFREFNDDGEAYQAWSCCLNQDKNSKGCMKQYDKKRRWNSNINNSISLN